MTVFVAEGYLNLVSQEGGYVGPDWWLDKSSLSDSLAKHFNVTRITWSDPGWQEMPYVPGDIPIGRVRITIERIADAQGQPLPKEKEAECLTT